MLIKNIRFSILVALFLVVIFTWGVSAQNKTPFFNKRAGGGMVIADQTQTTGNYWFVDSGSATGADGAGYGQNPDAPCLTIDYAFGLADESNGDVIVAMPGHAENISTASQIDIDKAGIRIIGIGVGRTRPKLTWTGANGYIEVNAANCSMENIVLDLSTTGIAATGVSMFTNGTDFLFKNMEVILYEKASGSGAATAAINAWSGGTRTQIEGCSFIGDIDSESGVTSVIAIAGNALDDIYIVDSRIIAYSSSPLINGSGSAVTNFVIDSAMLRQGSTLSTDLGIDMTSANGVMMNTVLSTPSGQTLFNTTGLASVIH
uniref:Pectate lyase n=1 Tax=viral metagenome TaxID=1070528 RepID=A0A6M3K9D8_9ZZZZ